MLKAIHAQESRDAADRKARDRRRPATARMNTAADLVERSVSETLTYYAFPDIHWQKIHQQPARADHARDSSADPCR
jgi:transposase-like protein